MIEIIGAKRIYCITSFVYKIYVKNGCVYMRIEETLCDNERYVIIIRTEDFLKRWIRTKCKEINHNIIIEITKCEIEKYKNAEDGFSQGINNPVPLAEVTYSNDIEFVDGMTRTEWLINNGAKSFPLVCSKLSAVNFYNNLSYKNIKIFNIKNLTNEISFSNFSHSPS